VAKEAGKFFCLMTNGVIFLPEKIIQVEAGTLKLRLGRRRYFSGKIRKQPSFLRESATELQG
jgi:hypothetical protein